MKGPAPKNAGQLEAPAEATKIHTQLLRLALGIEEARAYWAHVDPAEPAAERSLRAFEERWFGAKTLERVKTVLPYLAARYDAFPEALGVLRRWRGMDPTTRQVICHWHVQLADPIYRRFTAECLLERRSAHEPKVDRPAVARWVRSSFPGRWSEATIIQFASKLLSAASEAGLVSPKRDPRALLFPKVPDAALVYLLQLLRGVRYAGTLTENPYLDSVGLGGAMLDRRLRTIDGITLRRMGRLIEVDWAHPTLSAWAEATL
ncbi:MAG: DUF1819 family protein [Deltaproteobacteria bacterium]|nr:DUF1819 family protein [Deltaproteobacteria bacterium]